MGEPSATGPTTEKRMRRLTGGHEGVFFAKQIEGWRAVFSKIDPPLLLAIGWGSSGLD